jgi:hypothetical protein
MTKYAHQIKVGDYVRGYGIVTQVNYPDPHHVCMHYTGKKNQDVVVTFKNSMVVYLKDE